MTREANLDDIRSSKVFQLWLKGLTPNTRSVYDHYLAKLLKAADITPEQVLEEVKKDPVALWSKVKPQANTIASAKGRYTALYALRRFLVDNGFENLPRARINKPRGVKPRTYLTWDQALAICAAASRPYNLMFKLMLHSGWGIGEFLAFNTKETWESVKSYLASNPSAEYFRFTFPQRKNNPQEFYSLVPTFILKDIIALGIQLPLSSQGRQNEQGIPLDKNHYHSAGMYSGAAFRTAVKKAPIVVQGKPTIHDLRDTFRTRAEFAGCRASAPEFVMGHQIDPLEYNKCFYDEGWLWNELKKIFGPMAVTEDTLATRDARMQTLESENKDLKARLERLEALSVERLVLAAATKRKRASPRKH
jgi:integrase